MQNRGKRQEIHNLLSLYSESNRNPTNELIHIVCVPLIVFSLLGIIWAIHPIAAVVVVAAALYYYFQLSKPFAIGMLAMSTVMLVLLALLPPATVLA